MRVDDVGAKFAERFDQSSITYPVHKWINASSQFRDLNDSKSDFPCPIHQAAFRTDSRTRDQRDLVTKVAMLIFARKKRVLLCPANDHSSNHMGNMHKIVPVV